MRAGLPPRSSTAALSLRADTQRTLRDHWLAWPVPTRGGLAQLGEHYVRNVGVAGSTPVPSTKLHFVRADASLAPALFIAAPVNTSSSSDISPRLC